MLVDYKYGRNGIKIVETGLNMVVETGLRPVSTTTINN